MMEQTERCSAWADISSGLWTSFSLLHHFGFSPPSSLASITKNLLPLQCSSLLGFCLSCGFVVVVQDTCHTFIIHQIQTGILYTHRQQYIARAVMSLYAQVSHINYYVNSSYSWPSFKNEQFVVTKIKFVHVVISVLCYICYSWGRMEKVNYDGQGSVWTESWRGTA